MRLEDLGKVVAADMVVIGGGIGGHVCAITARERHPDLRVVVVEKASAGKTGPSALVGGRYTAFLPETDDYDGYFKESVEETDYLCDQDKIADYLDRSGEVFRNLERWGVKFVKTEDGHYKRPSSRGYASGMLFDGGGLPAMKALNGYARKIGVEFHDRIMITDLLADGERIAGAVGFHVRTGDYRIFRSRVTVIATGMTRFKTIQPGHRNDTGDGYAMAYRAGAELGGFDSTWHNTYGARLELGPGNNLYVGLGGLFLNNKGERFMHKYFPQLAERAPFVWLSPAFCVERMEGRAPPIWLDMRHFDADRVQTLWDSVPYAMIRYERAGILKGDRFVELIEYTPEGPRPMPSGVVTDRDYESRNRPGLFAIGDATSQKGGSGLPGAAVSGAIAGAAAAARAAETGGGPVDLDQVAALRQAAFGPLDRPDGIEPDHLILAVQEAIHPYQVGIIRHQDRLEAALREIERVRNDLLPLVHAYDPHYLMSANEARNMALCAEMFLRSAMERKESRLGCLREDYRDLDNVNWLKYVMLKHDAGKMDVWTEDVPIERYPLKPKRERSRHPFWEKVRELGYRTTPEK